MSPKALYITLDESEQVGGKKYKLIEGITYLSPRYKKWVDCPVGMLSDGATGAKDLPGSASWWVHDKLCEDAAFSDGTPCTAWQASIVLRDILFEEGHGFRARTWTWATFLLGSWKNKSKAGWVKLDL